MSLNWGFTVQYSLPYYSSHISEIDNSFLKHLIPLTEFTFQRADQQCRARNNSYG